MVDSVALHDREETPFAGDTLEFVDAAVLELDVVMVPRS
jgi:hypothetical protein